MQPTAYAKSAGGDVAVRAIITPEGVPVHFGIARAGDRIGAFVVDFLLLLGVSVALALLLGLFSAAGGGWVAIVLGQLGLFGLWVFWWAFFELRWNGVTPGKRWLGLRVVDRRGGLLTAEAVLARNLMRLIETWAPLAALLSGGAIFAGSPGMSGLIASAWLLVFAVLPLTNRDRLRVGDLVAGTMVVVAPKATLLADLSRDVGEESEARYPFTPAQLDHYGIHELQVLEDLLRHPSTNAETLALVRDKIQRKIGWRRGRRPEPAEAFLRDFYDAQRARLEGRLLMGERRERKTESRKRPPPPR